MSLFNKPIETLDHLLSHMLEGMHYAEQRIAQTLPRMIDAAADRDLRDALATHLAETGRHLARLERILAPGPPDGWNVACVVIDGILGELDTMPSRADDPDLRHTALIWSARMIGQYEISRYTAILAVSRQLGRPGIADLLAQTIAEQRDADRRLSKLACRMRSRPAIREGTVVAFGHPPGHWTILGTSGDG